MQSLWAARWRVPASQAGHCVIVAVCTASKLPPREPVTAGMRFVGDVTTTPGVAGSSCCNLIVLPSCTGVDL